MFRSLEAGKLSREEDNTTAEPVEVVSRFGMGTMPPSQEVQWDLEQAPPGGTFLVLNVGTNTVGLGSSCFFQTFPPVAIRTASPPKAGPFAASSLDADGSDQDAVEEIATAVAADGGGRGDSAHQGPALPKSPPRRGRRKGKDDDPGWVRDMDERGRSGSSACGKAAAKSKQLRQVGNPSEEASMGGDANASSSSEENPTGLIEVRQDYLPRCSDGGETDGGENGLISSVEEPPPYLVSLLHYFGWTVTIDGADGAAYTSPKGVIYHSLPKVFETFLHDSSKGEEEERSLAEPLDGGGLHDSSKGEEKESSFAQPLVGGGMGAPDLNQPTGLSTRDVAKGRLKKRQDRKKKRQGRKKKTDARVAIAAPVIPQLQPLATVVEVSEKDGKRPPVLPKETVSPSKEVNQMAITRRVTRRSSSKNESLNVQLPGPRRSARLSGKHTFYGSDSDPEDDVSLYSPETDEEMLSSLNSGEAKEVCVVKSEGCREQEVPGSEDPDCCTEIIIEGNQSGSYTMHQENAALEIRRSGHGSEEQFRITMEINLERKCESNLADLSDIQNTNVVKSSDGELSMSTPEMLNIAHEEPNSCKYHLMIRETEKFDNNSMVPAINAQNNSTEVKRYMDLNMKDVTEDVETGIEMGVDARFSTSSTHAVNSLASENDEEPRASAVEVENTKGGKCVPDDVSAKDLAEHVTCDTLKAQAEPKSKNPEKTATKKKGSKKSLRQGDNLKVQVPLTSTPLKPASKRKSAYAGCSNEKRKKGRPRHALAVQENVKDDQQKEIPLQKKVTALSWLIDAGILSEGEVLVHKVKNDRTNHLTGLATRNGIVCLCCNKTMSLSEFEIHAGRDLCQPWYNICLESGKSLMQCQMEAWKKEKNMRQVGFQTVGADGLDPSDDTCGVCADGGNLICCDGCPSTFHQDCIMLNDFPEGRWHCPYCVCTFCLAIEDGSDKLSQMTLFTCQQCYRKYHWECTSESCQPENFAESLLFCGKNCREVDAGLFRLLGVVNKIEEGFSWTLLKRLDEHEELNSDSQLLFMMECNRKLSMALSVLNECFMPVVDNKTGVELISHAVYNCGSNFRRLNYAGFYGAILEKDEEIISVASLRFHGRDLAEMPFMGTRSPHHRQNMCHRLLKAIEDLLSSLHVKKLIVPATPELLETWMTSFAFQPLEQSNEDEIRSFSLLVLPRTSLLQKSISPKGEEYDLAGATAGEVAPGAQDVRSDVGKQTNSGSTVVGDHGPSPRRNLETDEDTDKHAAPVQSQTEVKTCHPAGDARGAALRPGSSTGPVPETPHPA
ncbi:hypothetical protein Taro_013655 [Colocasia esculenta]|uniref:PHD-type domain-containing protein n=1 Tax=Colocasia esculenta TaxID=4460 RepID=A0A843UG54_COLES|nr:hypothetical protein [Colocasia esculenta]